VRLRPGAFNVCYAPSDDDGTPPPPNPPQMPEGLPTQYWDQTAGAVNMPELIKGFGELNTFKTEHEKRLADLAARKPDDIKIVAKLPEGLKLPPNTEIKIDEKDPRVAAVRALAIKRGFDQETVDDLVAIEVAQQAQAEIEADAAVQAEQKKLGQNGPARVKAAESFLSSKLSAEKYEAVRPFIGNALAFEAIEDLIKLATTQQIPNNNGGTPPPEVKPKPRPADIFYNRQKAS
jgi:hypothetical protein